MHIKTLKFACLFILFIIYNIKYLTKKRCSILVLLVYEKEFKMKMLVNIRLLNFVTSSLWQFIVTWHWARRNFHVPLIYTGIHKHFSIIICISDGVRNFLQFLISAARVVNSLNTLHFIKIKCQLRICYTCEWRMAPN